MAEPGCPEALLAEAAAAGATVRRAPGGALARAVDTVTPHGVAAVARMARARRGRRPRCRRPAGTGARRRVRPRQRGDAAPLGRGLGRRGRGVLRRVGRPLRPEVRPLVGRVGAAAGRGAGRRQRRRPRRLRRARPPHRGHRRPRPARPTTRSTCAGPSPSCSATRPTACRGGGRGGRRGGDDPDGGPRRIPQRGHGGHGPVLRGPAAAPCRHHRPSAGRSTPGRSTPPEPGRACDTASIYRTGRDAAAGGRVHDDMTDPTSSSGDELVAEIGRLEDEARARIAAAATLDELRAVESEVPGKRSATERVPQAARRSRRREPAHGGQGPQRGERRRAGGRRRAPGGARGRGPHRAAARRAARPHRGAPGHARRAPAPRHPGDARARGRVRRHGLHGRRRPRGRDRLEQLRGAELPARPPGPRHVRHALRRLRRPGLDAAAHPHVAGAGAGHDDRAAALLLGHAGPGLPPTPPTPPTCRCSTRSRGW